MLLKFLILRSRGNISFISAVILVILSILFLVVFDLCRIFIVREETKKASDAASLAAAQNLLFFDSSKCCEIAGRVAELNNCKMVDCSFDYDCVTVEVKKNINFAVLGGLMKESGTVSSESRAKVLYPWDEYFGYCDYYKFSY
ncbi:MAG: Rv3654c family TadE-like protein [Actinomycetota bacterium]|nr:Rv3654c family TadE-like protein [Actinomycetota bacterium]